MVSSSATATSVATPIQRRSRSATRPTARRDAAPKAGAAVAGAATAPDGGINASGPTAHAAATAAAPCCWAPAPAGPDRSAGRSASMSMPSDSQAKRAAVRWPKNSVSSRRAAKLLAAGAPSSKRFTTTFSGRMPTVASAPTGRSPAGHSSSLSRTRILPSASTMPGSMFMRPTKPAQKRVRGDAVELVGRAGLLDAALVHQHHAVGHRQGLFLVVRDHHAGDAQALLQCADFAAQAGAHLARRAPTAARRAAAGAGWVPARAPGQCAAAARPKAAPGICRHAPPGPPGRSSRASAWRSGAPARRWAAGRRRCSAVP